MVCRMWRGFTRKDNAALYHSYLQHELFPKLAATIAAQGYRGHHILTRDVGGETEFTTLVWFDSLEAIQSFAGAGFEQAVVTERAASLLAHWDPLATHHALCGASAGPV